jgi:diguanylate cyclase (GGDEF)-like protein
MPNKTMTRPNPILEEALFVTNDDEMVLDTSAAGGLYTACKKMAQGFIAGQMDDLFKIAHDQLFALAKDSLSDDAQRNLFDAMQELHRLRDSIATGFEAAIEDRFNQAWQADLADAMADRPDMDGAEMSLIDTQSLDDEVRVLGIVAQTAGALKQQEYELKERLSVLLSVPPTEQTNPLTVRSFCCAFHAALKNLGAERETRRALFTGLSGAVAEHLGRLLDEVNQFLIEHDVLPDGPRRVIKKRPSAPDTTAMPNAGSDAAENTRTALPPSKAHGPGKQANHAESSVNPDPSLPFADAASSAQTLIALCRAIDAGRAGRIDAAHPQAKPGVREIVGLALAQIQATGEASGWGEKGPLALALRVEQKLAEYGVTISDVATKDMVEVISILFDSLLADPMVEAHSKTWIRATAVPVLRAALTDGSFFASDVHAARGVINILAECGFGRAAANSRERVHHDKTSKILQGLLAGQGPVEAAFGTAEQGLRKIQAEQAKLRARNIDKAAAAAEQNCPPPDAGQAPAGDTELDSVGLDVGAVVILRGKKQQSCRAEVGWRSADGQNYLFVDALGHPLASLGAARLARCIETKIVAPVEVARMPAVDRAMCAVLQNIHEKLEHKATSDPDTGLATTKTLEQAIKKALAHATTAGRRHHLVYIGIDTFPEIKRRAGRKGTVRLAQQYAGVLQRQVAESGLVARVSPACFVLFLPNSRRADVEGLVERHRKSVEVTKVNYEGADLVLQVSIGAVSLADNANDPVAAISAAQEAFMAAEKIDGNTVYFSNALVEPSANNARRRQRNKDRKDRKSFKDYAERGELGLRAQRIEAIVGEDGSSAGMPYYEVLLGIRGEDGRLNPPGDIVLAAELDGEVKGLDNWVLTTALTWMASHTDWLRSVQGLSINLSGATLDEPGLAEKYHSLIDYYGVDPQKIMFEVTESATIGHLSTARGFIESLRQRGCRFALDDFGAGHASFSYLKLLPVDTVKIDGLFVRDLVSDRSDQAMVRSIHEIAKLLGKCTVAEFVENDAALDVLRRIGVDYAQGYGIALPVPIDELSDGRTDGSGWRHKQLAAR